MEFRRVLFRSTATTRGTSRHTPSVTSEMALVHTLKWVFAWFLERPALIGQSAESLARLEISHQGLGRFRQSLLDAAMRYAHLDKSALYHTLSSACVRALADEVRRSNRPAFSVMRCAGDS